MRRAASGSLLRTAFWPLVRMGAAAQMAYGWSFIAWMLQPILALFVAAAFWRAVYGDRETISGLAGQSALTYILLANIILRFGQTELLRLFGRLNAQGQIAIELLRPADFQLSTFAQWLGRTSVSAASQLPLLVPVAFALGMRPSSSLPAWMMAIIVFGLGLINVFLVDWIVACLAFYTTYVWGISVLYSSVLAFFSGALVPYAFMPGWLQQAGAMIPIAQLAAAPAGLLSGHWPPSQAWPVIGFEILTILVLFPASRIIFNFSIRSAQLLGG